MGVVRVTLAEGWSLCELGRVQQLLDQPGVKAVVLEGVETLSDGVVARTLCDALEAAPVLLVALVRGRCGVAGTGLLEACHLRIASSSATFEQPGLLDQVVPPKDLDGALEHALGETVATRPAHVVHAVLQALHLGRGPREDALRGEAALFLGLLRHAPGPVRICARAVEHSEVQSASAALLDAHFLPAERADRPLRSLAGALALKRAILELLAAERPDLHPLNVRVDHLDDGAPVVSCPGGPPLPARLFVSISHTRRRSHALAAVQPDAVWPVAPSSPRRASPERAGWGTRLVLERDGDLAHLVLDRPPHNRMDRAFFEELAALCDRELPGLDARGLIIRGRGRHFSAGADLDELRARAGDPEEQRAELDRNTAALLVLERLPYPVIAAISGVCLGSGLELALACHRRVAAENSVLSLPEVEHGLLPGCGGTVRLAERVGHRRAAMLILGATRLSAEEAAGLGLVDEVVARSGLLAAAAVVARCGEVARSPGIQRTGARPAQLPGTHRNHAPE